MKKWMAWTIGGILLFLVLAAILIFMAVTMGWVKAPTILETHSSWGKVSPVQTEVVTSVVIDNPSKIGINLGNVHGEADLFLNDIHVGHGSTSGLHIPKGISTTQMVSAIDNSTIPEWWASHVSNGEKTTVRILTKGVAGFLWWHMKIDGPTVTREVQTNLLFNANSDQAEVISAGPFSITIKSRQFRWGAVTPQQTAIYALFLVNNGSPVPITVTNVDFVITMNGIAVGQGMTSQPIVIPPQTDTSVPVQMSITNLEMLDWWPTHIAAGERTQYQINVNANVAATIPGLGQQSATVHVLAYSDQFQTNILGQ